MRFRASNRDSALCSPDKQSSRGLNLRKHTIGQKRNRRSFPLEIDEIKEEQVFMYP